jgi:N-acetylmuramoyl-L-alanine amidase
MLRQVRGIIAHWTANTRRGADALANRNYFNNGSPGPNRTFRAASAHYCVDSDGIIQCLPDNEVGFHIGGAHYKPEGIRLMAGYKGFTPNYFAIGFEMCVNEDGDWNKTLENSVDLAAYLIFKHGLTINNLHRHYDITGKDCPRMMIESKKWEEFKRNVAIKYANIYTRCRRAAVTSKELNVRKGPGAEHSINHVLKQGDRVVIFPGGNANWVCIGENKFVNQKYLTNGM